MVSSKFGLAKKVRGTPPICRKPPPLVPFPPVTPSRWPPDEVPFNFAMQWDDPILGPQSETWIGTAPRNSAWTYNLSEGPAHASFAMSLALDPETQTMTINVAHATLNCSISFAKTEIPVTWAQLTGYSNSNWDTARPSGATCAAEWTV